MKTMRTLLSALLGLSAAVALYEQDALAGTPLRYGQSYYLQNGYAGFQYGGYLDTRGAGCQGDDLCVSTATTSTRDSGSGTWEILSATGKAQGAPVLGGDVIYIHNMYHGNGGYLDTDGSGCQGDELCVATSQSSNRDNGSGSWMILPISGGTGAAVNEEDAVRLENGWAGFGNNWAGYLDTDGNGCQGNDLCVATSATPDRDNGSTWWRLQANDELATGQTLTTGSAIDSSDGRLRFEMQSDGNLVLYFSPFDTWQYALWASNTAGHPGASAIMQDDGNFVVYDTNGSALWATGTASTGSFIDVQNDGNVVVYDEGGSPLWSSNTAPSVPPASMCINSSKNNTYFCPAGSWWHSCQAPEYTPGAALVNGDPNVVVYCADVGNGWTDNELNQAGTLTIQTCGNDDGKLTCSPADPYGPLPTD